MAYNWTEAHPREQTSITQRSGDLAGSLMSLNWTPSAPMPALLYSLHVFSTGLPISHRSCLWKFQTSRTPAVVQWDLPPTTSSLCSSVSPQEGAQCGWGWSNSRGKELSSLWALAFPVRRLNLGCHLGWEDMLEVGGLHKQESIRAASRQPGPGRSEGLFTL